MAIEHDDSDAEARRRFAVPPAGAGEEALAALDPADRDDRAMLIRAAHPGLERAAQGREHVEGAEGPVDARLHLTMHEVVANQLCDEDPPEVWRTAKRLRAAGYEHHEILHMLASTIVEQLWAAGSQQGSYDPDRHRAALQALPGSWAERPRDPPAQDHRPRADRRARRPPRRRGGA